MGEKGILNNYNSTIEGLHVRQMLGKLEAKRMRGRNVLNDAMQF